MATEINYLPANLKNKYILARHGYSLANDAGIICSNPEIAIPATGGPLGDGYGLHAKGKLQVKESATRLVEYLYPNGYNGDEEEPIKVFCSPFKRTKETAAIFCDTLNNDAFAGKQVVAPATEAYALRERWFGNYDMKSDDLYDECWAADAEEPDHGENSTHDVESPNAVCARATKFILDEIESKMQGKTVLLVAHGDIFQIMGAAFLRIEPWRQRQLAHVNTAEWRSVDQLKLQ
ncbi:histidine phosphatase superfamily [Gongronella butleri]|nr:histidine phosphatase superfamily [Gongronella butleri]